jgi:hypothetical protein
LSQQKSSQFPPEIREAFEPRTALKQPKGPLVYRWVFDPDTGNVHLSHNRGHNLEVEHHRELGEKVKHPSRVHGYAHRIVNGWRITDWDSDAIKDKFVVRQVLHALAREEDGLEDDEDAEIHEFTGRAHYGLP